MSDKTIYNIQLALVWLGVTAGFAGVVVQMLTGGDSLDLVGALGGFFWPLTCLTLIISNHRLKQKSHE
jgi:hypothetical protein